MHMSNILEVEYLLSHNAKANDKLTAWTAWHSQFIPHVDDYSNILQLAQKAAVANGLYLNIYIKLLLFYILLMILIFYYQINQMLKVIGRC